MTNLITWLEFSFGLLSRWGPYFHCRRRDSFARHSVEWIASGRFPGVNPIPRITRESYLAFSPFALLYGILVGRPPHSQDVNEINALRRLPGPGKDEIYGERASTGAVARNVLARLVSAPKYGR